MKDYRFIIRDAAELMIIVIWVGKYPSSKTMRVKSGRLHQKIGKVVLRNRSSSSNWRLAGHTKHTRARIHPLSTAYFNTLEPWKARYIVHTMSLRGELYSYLSIQYL